MSVPGQKPFYRIFNDPHLEDISEKGMTKHAH